MSDDIVVVDGGEVYETQESSIIAKDEADRAEKWGKLAEERADIATSASFEAIKSKDEAAQYAATTKSNRDYVNSLLNSSGFKAVANDMLATPSAIKTALQNANNAAADAENAAESATLANDSAGDAAHWADDSRIWAVGSDTEVNQLAPNQGKHSSKTYADLAGNEADRAQQEADRAKQYVDMGELADKITNCITEIPQDIKLELNNGTLTLKAGSKLYQPNGVGVFTEINITSDKTRVGGLANEQTMFFWDVSANGIRSRVLDEMISGTTAPTKSTRGATWYDTAENKIKFYNGVGVVESSGGCFPLCICSSDGSGTITSIDQVFNGFGYIGSTVFVLPGVKELVPNGRNADGSLKNIEFTVSSVLTRTFTWDISYSGQFFAVSTTGLASSGTNNPFYQQEEIPPVKPYTYWYKPSENIMYSNGSGTTWYKTDLAVVGRIVGDNTGKITSFTHKTAFHAVDRNDSSWVSAQAMPGGKYISLTPGASEANYTAPANGYFTFSVKSSSANIAYATGAILSSDSEVVLLRSHIWIPSNVSGNYTRGFLPCKKGQRLFLGYYNATIDLLQFTYAEGEE